MAELKESETKALASKVPFGIICGAQGAGKSAEVGSAFPDWLYFKTRHDTLAGLEDYIKSNPDEAKRRNVRVPQHVRTLIDDRDSRGNPLTNWATWYRDKMHSIAMAKKAGKFPWPGVVFDEFNTILGWMQDSIYRPKGVHGEGLSGYPGQDEMIKLITWLHQVRAHTGIGVICVCHWDEPRYFVEGEQRGKLKYPGRPMTPLGRYAPFLTKDASFVWQLTRVGQNLKYYCTAEYDGDQVINARKTGLWNKPMEEGGSNLLDSSGCWEVRDGFGLREAIEGMGWEVSQPAGAKR